MTLLDEVIKEEEVLKKRSAKQMIEDIDNAIKNNHKDIKKLFK